MSSEIARPAAPPPGRRLGRPRRVSHDDIYIATLLALGDAGGGFTLAQVAGRLGVTPAAIRQRYGSRRGLIVAMARTRVIRTKERFETASRLAVPRLEALQSALVAELGLVERPEQVAHVFSAYTDLISDAEVAAIFRDEIESMVDGTDRLLREAVAAGELTVPVGREIATALVAAAEGSMLLWALAPEGDLIVRVRSAVRMVLGVADPAE